MTDIELNRGELEARAAARRPAFESWLRTLVEIPTVSTDPERAADVRRGAEAAAELLRSLGGSAELIETDGLPLVYGALPGDPGWPTVTIYNHLDVQPADGDAWHQPPFELRVDGERYGGRGATDDKGPALTALLGAVLAREAGVPLNIRFLWETEEENGSVHFEDALLAHAGRMGTDLVVISDTIWITRGKPSSSTGLRGLQPFSFYLETAEVDAHSGVAGGAARNPLAELAQVVAACVDGRTGEVLIPGFYDRVTPLSDVEAASFVASGFSAERFAQDMRLSSMRSTDALEVMRRVWARPTFEVHGFVGGYVGPGVKTVIPPRAQVKVSCRLVPGMTCASTVELVRDFIASRFPDVRVEASHGLEPFQGVSSGPLAEAVVEAYRFGFGVEPAFVREGGSIGAASTMEALLGAPLLFMGMSLPEHGYHAPNEHYDWGQASGGAMAFARLFELVSRPGALPGR